MGLNHSRTHPPFTSQRPWLSLVSGPLATLLVSLAHSAHSDQPLTFASSALSPDTRSWPIVPWLASLALPCCPAQHPGPTSHHTTASTRPEWPSHYPASLALNTLKGKNIAGVQGPAPCRTHSRFHSRLPSRLTADCLNQMRNAGAAGTPGSPLIQTRLWHGIPGPGPRRRAPGPAEAIWKGRQSNPQQRRPFNSKVAFISSSAGAKSLNKYFPGVEERLSSQP